ncbi:MAG: hypothetical protein A2489_00065 [Candidatus Moranbacteria bacterium RIFOXYC12_FULL_36_13]|nr:MAG: hypothetical protein A2343_03730 [Candidatus Moranbacteria bacterium RIFOXYB12_FULL_35_8]OGI32069.1 MAG: hypothetical protein A2489_00065 [Candidatus Moranbacteria bacterium RIFOXYC12_FULL_36_13]
MHQTFYIDIDEEITSIVERLKKARTNEVVIVVPKRALLIQSIVNLKILKKEADENEIQLMIVTQDRLGKVLIEKAGIFVQQKMDNIADGEIDLDGERINEGGEEFYPSENGTIENRGNQTRLSGMGSESYFDEKGEEENPAHYAEKIKIKRKIKINEELEPAKEQIIHKELVSGFGNNAKKKNIKTNLDISTETENAPIVRFSSKKEAVEDEYKKEKIDNFFYQPSVFQDNRKKAHSNEFKNYNLSKKDHKWFLAFGLFSIFVLIGIVSYLFLPKAVLTITADVKTESIDSSVAGSTSAIGIDFEKEIIPAKEISVETSLKESFNASGNKAVSNQKARGKIIIYNEYSSSPQPLVATTRFLSSNGKLFRLINGITIPGMETSAGEKKPGTVEAQVIADEAGESFNIGPDKFTIPGFQGSGEEKYAKFYAKSEEAMKGGGSGDQTANYITDEDINSAKTKILTNFKEEIKRKLAEASGEEAIILEDAIKEEEPVYKLSNSSGDVADSFEITIQTKVKAIIVAKKDINEIASKMIAKAKNGAINIDNNSIKFDFGKANTDFTAGTIDIKFHAVGEIIPNLDLEAIKKEIMGKNNEELSAYLSTFSNIKNANVEYQPSFINSKIPSIANRVEIVLDK